MTEEIKYEDMPEKVAAPLKDSEIADMQRKAVKQIEQAQIKQQEKIKAGIVEVPSAAEGVPKELPFLFFHYGSKVLKCEKFQTSDEENKILAHHLSIIFANLIKNVWVWSVIAIMIILVGKIVTCWASVKNLISRKEKTESEEPKNTQVLFEETKKSEVV